MNLSNDILFKAVSAFVDAISDGISQSVEERLKDRIQKLEDKFDQITTAADERIVEVVKNDSDIADHIRGIAEVEIETALENYDPTDHMDDDDIVSTVIESYQFQDGIKDAVRELSFTVEVH